MNILAVPIVTALASLFLCGSGGSCVLPVQYSINSPVDSRIEASIPETMDKNTQINSGNPLVLAQQLPISEEARLNVPFTSQAPYKKWVLPYSEACEEASVIMNEYYLRGKPLDLQTADSEIVNLIKWQQQNGYGVDISAEQAGNHAENYYGRKAWVYTGELVTEENIKALLSAGYPVIIPVAGQQLGNPHFQNGGPPYHMLILIGYNQNGFISHDPGTQYGENYVYPYSTIMNAIHDWTGSKNTVTQGQKAILVITAK